MYVFLLRYSQFGNKSKGAIYRLVDFYTLFDKFALGEPLANAEEEHYVMAVLVRGGVFGKG